MGANGWQHEETFEPTALVTRLAAEFGGEVPQLRVTRPSLEDVYLQMIGAAAGPGPDEAR